jgi:hypothetical protein
MNVLSMVVLVVMPCNTVLGRERFGGTCCLHLQWMTGEIVGISTTILLVTCLYNLTGSRPLTLTLKMETEYSSEMFVSSYNTIYCNNSEDQI